MDDPMRVNPGLALPLSEITLRASRSSGPGGQHANVTASRIEAVFDVRASETLTSAQRARLLQRLGPVVRAVAQDARSQALNREKALERLRDRIAAALVVQPPRRPTRPTRASKERRLTAKRVTGDRKRGRRPPPSDDN
jgi:ribosome-associated protein